MFNADLIIILCVNYIVLLKRATGCTYWVWGGVYFVLCIYVRFCCVSGAICDILWPTVWSQKVLCYLCPSSIRNMKNSVIYVRVVFICDGHTLLRLLVVAQFSVLFCLCTYICSLKDVRKLSCCVCWYWDLVSCMLVYIMVGQSHLWWWPCDDERMLIQGLLAASLA